jgi:hypothetical protein
MCVFVCVFINAGMPDCPASDQSGTGMKKNNNAGTDPVPDQAGAVRHFFGPIPELNNGCQNADAAVSFLDADAQLCIFSTNFTVLAYAKTKVNFFAWQNHKKS